MSRPLTDGKREFNWAALAQVSIYGLALLLAKLVGLATLPIFTSFLSPADYGRLEVLQTLANLVSLVLAFGLTEALFKFVARETDPGRRQELLGTIWTLALAGAAVSAVVLQILAPWIHAVLPGGVALLDTRIILASLSVGALILVPLAYLRMTDRPWAYFFGSAGRAAIQALLAIALLSAGWGLTGVLIAGLICAMGLAAWLCVFMLRQVRTTFRRQDAGAMLHFGGTIVLAGGAIFIVDTFDRWLLAGAIGPAELGRYAVAAKVGVLVSFALQPFLMWWLPRRFAVLNEPGGLVQSARMSELAIVLTCLAVVATASGAPFLIALMTPAAYHGAIVYVPAVAVLAALNSASHLVDTGCLRP
ncbi:MAG: lipopolysaccharide biosynthesis protein, partial [Pseudomonadota bacterium]